MVEYKLVDGNFTEDGHTMFKTDVVTRLERLDFLEKYKKNLIKVIDKHFWNWEDHHYECEDGFLEDLALLSKGEFVIQKDSVEVEE